MATNLANIPFQSPIADQNGVVTMPWSNWFRDLFRRTGSGQALSNTELASELSAGTLAADITALQASVLALQSATTSEINQGRAL